MQSVQDTREFAAMQHAIAYYRVSTARQGLSGLGIEAQRATVARFAEAEPRRQASRGRATGGRRGLCQPLEATSDLLVRTTIEVINQAAPGATL